MKQSISLLALLAFFTLPLNCAAATTTGTAHKAVKSSTVTTKTSGKAAGAPKSVKPAAPPEAVETYIDVSSEELVDKPQEYLNKNVRFTAKFFAFSSLALDYKPALRSSKSYLSFLVLRSHSHIPLSELKIALPIPKEKDPENQLIAVLKDGDTIELSGKIFSTALGEPWIDVQHIKKVGSSDDKATAEESTAEDKDKPAESQPPETKHESPKP